MLEAGIEDVRRLRLRAVGVRGMDDLTQPGEYSVPESVATVAVRRLRRRGRVLSLIGLMLFAGFVVGANLLVDRADDLLATGEPTWRRGRREFGHTRFGGLDRRALHHRGRGAEPLDEPR